MKIMLKVKIWNRIKRFLYSLINNLSRQKFKQCTKLDYSIRSTSTRNNSDIQTSNWYICSFRIKGRKKFSINRRNKRNYNDRKTISKKEKKKNP